MLILPAARRTCAGGGPLRRWVRAARGAAAATVFSPARRWRGAPPPSRRHSRRSPLPLLCDAAPASRSRRPSARARTDVLHDSRNFAVLLAARQSLHRSGQLLVGEEGADPRTQRAVLRKHRALRQRLPGADQIHRQDPDLVGQRQITEDPLKSLSSPSVARVPSGKISRFLPWCSEREASINDSRSEPWRSIGIRWVKFSK